MCIIQFNCTIVVKAHKMCWKTLLLWQILLFTLPGAKIFAKSDDEPGVIDPTIRYETKNQNNEPKNFPPNCIDVPDSETYALVKPNLAKEPFWVRCNSKWTYLMYRDSDQQKFDLPWKEYKMGFGNIAGTFWLGLEYMHQLTGSELYELRFELTDWNNRSVAASYEAFAISDEEKGYAINLLGKYSGDAGDSFSYHAGLKFSTIDKDQDNSFQSCSELFGEGGWWFNACRRSLLTGKYAQGYVGSSKAYKIMHWDTYYGHTYGLQKVAMMIRPKRQ